MHANAASESLQIEFATGGQLPNPSLCSRSSRLVGAGLGPLGHGRLRGYAWSAPTYLGRDPVLEVLAPLVRCVTTSKIDFDPCSLINY